MNTAALRVVSALVVDDHHDSADAFAGLLTCWGYEAHAVYDGAGALGLAARLRPDIVLLDLSLPDMDGFRVADQLRCDLGLGHTLLIILSGYSAEMYEDQALAAGCDHYLVKPVNPEELRRLLASCEPAPEHALPREYSCE